MVSVLFRKEIKNTFKILIAFMAILLMYHFIIIDMFDTSKSKTLEALMNTMGGMMEAFGMKPGAKGLLGHISMYLYGFIMILFPSIFIIIMGNMLMGSYLDNGSMAYLLASPHKRSSLDNNQKIVMKLNLIILVIYVGIITLVLSQKYKTLDTKNFLIMLIGILFLYLFLSSLTMLVNIYFADSGKSILFMTGFLLIMYLFQMGSNMGNKFSVLKYFTIFSLYNAPELSKGTPGSFIGPIVLLLGSILLDIISQRIFIKKDYSL